MTTLHEPPQPPRPHTAPCPPCGDEPTHDPAARCEAAECVETFDGRYALALRRKVKP